MSNNTPWLGPDLEKMELAFVEAFVPNIKTRYRGWQIIATEKNATATDGNGERFEANIGGGFEATLRQAKQMVDRRCQDE